MKNDKIIVSGDKVFYSLQGEGNSIGKPAVFLRLKFCNLRCVWCDTPYAVFPDREDFKKEGEIWTIDKTLREIKKVAPKEIKRLVITGGEPLLQKEAIDKLIKRLENWDIEIETNGTILPTEYQLKRCQFNCSPKLSNSKNPKHLRIKKEVINILNKPEVNSFFKFVVQTVKDVEEMEKDFVLKFNILKNKIILMPEGVSIKKNRKHFLNFVEYAKIKGYRVLPRLQIFIWGIKRRT